MTSTAPTADPLQAAPAPAASAPALAPATAGPGHLGAVDVLRLLTVGGVILVHCTSLTVSYGSVAAGAVLEIGHVTRSVFLLLSAFVLTYSFNRRPLRARAFWRRRYPLVVVPYLAWSAIYVLTDGDLRSPGHAAAELLRDLPDGGAHFHLYFLLLSMQLYLVFPALMAGVRRWRKALVPVLWAALGLELALTAAMHYGRWPQPVAGWIGHCGVWLPTYVLFVAGGIAAAAHFDAVTAWVRRHYRLIALGWAASVALGIASYLCDLAFLGYTPYKASEVFQPAIVLEAVAATGAQYALGLWLVDRLPQKHLDRLERSSDVSFGVYLAHPLVIGAMLDVAVACGAWKVLGGVPSGLGEAMVAIVLVPAVYAACYLTVIRARRTRFSLALTGRKRAAAAPQRGSAEVSRVSGMFCPR